MIINLQIEETSAVALKTLFTSRSLPFRVPLTPEIVDELLFELSEDNIDFNKLTELSSLYRLVTGTTTRASFLKHLSELDPEDKILKSSLLRGALSSDLSRFKNIPARKREKLEKLGLLGDALEDLSIQEKLYL